MPKGDGKPGSYPAPNDVVMRQAAPLTNPKEYNFGKNNMPYFPVRCYGVSKNDPNCHGKQEEPRCYEWAAQDDQCEKAHGANEGSGQNRDISGERSFSQRSET